MIYIVGNARLSIYYMWGVVSFTFSSHLVFLFQASQSAWEEMEKFLMEMSHHNSTYPQDSASPYLSSCLSSYPSTHLSLPFSRLSLPSLAFATPDFRHNFPHLFSWAGWWYWTPPSPLHSRGSSRTRRTALSLTCRVRASSVVMVYADRAKLL